MRTFSHIRGGAEAEWNCRGITLVETVIAVLITSLLALAINHASRTVLATSEEANSSWTATKLGMSLIEEICSQPFCDPDSLSATIGPDGAEWTAPWNRSKFNDVDDYSVWSNTTNPLQHKSGKPMHEQDFSRTVSISYIYSANIAVTSSTPTNYKLICVNVYKSNSLVRSIKTVRSKGGRDVDYND